MLDNAVIFDLDDTIFQTTSMDKNIFEPFLNHLTSNLQPLFSNQIIESIINDLWLHQWDTVIKKYAIPQTTFLKAIEILDNLELNLNIKTYDDYVYIKKINNPKFLVTTSLTVLQASKIRALKIENDFTKIIINDPFKGTSTKLDVFRNLVLEFELNPKKTYVIGDNPDSEIKAGNLLDMITIQILRDNVVKGDNAKYYIKSFNELTTIIDN